MRSGYGQAVELFAVVFRRRFRGHPAAPEFPGREPRDGHFVRHLQAGGCHGRRQGCGPGRRQGERRDTLPLPEQAGRRARRRGRGQGPQARGLARLRRRASRRSGAGGPPRGGENRLRAVGFKDVAGIDEAVDELKEVVTFLTSPERYTRLGGRLPKGVLLVGPPGTGKTLLARAVAGEAKVPFFSLSGSEFVEMFVGVGAARVRDLFEQAQKSAPCIIFIDELDALGRARGIGQVGSNEEREQTLNQLLTEMDGFDPNKGVVLMAATNRPEILDPALLRAGRFDRHVVVDRPDVKGREGILRLHLGKLTLSGDVDARTLAARTPGFVGADLANIVNEAALLAARAGKDRVAMGDFEEAIDRVLGGLQKKSGLMTPAEKHRVAHHEAGHALVAMLVEHADPVHKVSIIPRGIGALGYTLQLPTEDRHLYCEAELMDRLAVLLGGRVAEEICFGDLSTGAADDLQKATQLARRLILEFGMSGKLGPAAFAPPPSLFLGGLGESARGVFSEETARQVDAEIVTLLQGVRERVVRLLRGEEGLLRRLAETLIERESLDGEGVRELLARHRAGQPPVAAVI
ncbi:MAG: ATP-dependent zinc metalloprotease FtsH [Gammaproteobacteria bacterium]|nr:ATP-dependent zinc metalloprotease FtsH [Gammaproteobacteria bacterium]